MIKLIYKIAGYTSAYNHETDETERKQSIVQAIVENPTADDIAKAIEIAYNGEYSLEDDGEYVPPTTEERVSDLEDTAAALEDAMCEMDAANEERMAAIEDALCEIDMG